MEVSDSVTYNVSVIFVFSWEQGFRLRNDLCCVGWVVKLLAHGVRGWLKTWVCPRLLDLLLYWRKSVICLSR